MSFARVATQLIKQNQPAKPDKQERVDAIAELNAAGFSRREVLTELKALAEECDVDEKTVKFNILKVAAQMHGMLVPEETKRETPVINLTVIGDNTRMMTMIQSASGDN